MRILCIGSEPARVQAISEALDATALDAMVESCALGELEGRLGADVDALVIEGGAFDAWPQAERERLRAASTTQVWAILADDAAAALVAGADVVVAAATAADELAAEVQRALAARRDRMRWPRSFAVRRVLVVGEPAESLVAAGFVASVAEDGIHALEQLRGADFQAVLADGARLGGPVASFVESLRRYDPALGSAFWVASADEAVAARAAGAAAVRLGQPGDGGAVELAEAAWLAWSRAQPHSASEEPLRLGVGEGISSALREAAAAAGFHCVEAGECDALLTRDEVATLGRVPAALVTEDPRGRERLPWLAEVLAEDAGAEQALRALAERARDARAFEALARRLHEVDARRVELLEKLAARELELEHLATIDAATETLNRRGIEDAVLREVEAGRRSGGTVAACLVVCEGHEAGDEALRAVADRVKRVLRVTDAIGRVGGDELLVLLPQTRMAEALLVADRAAESVAQSPVLVAGERIGVNVGVAVLPWETSSLDEVVAVTRQALAQRRRLSDAPRDDGAAPDAPLELIARLARGEGLRAVFQPILHVADETIAGYEVLVRGPEGPYEAPEALLGLARQCGVLAEVDLACLRACLEHARKLPAEAPIHLNLCPTTLTHLSAEELVALFAGVATAPICLELSEDRFVGDAAALSERIAALRSAGVRLAIDDVGRGRGTLESVMVLEPDMVKIDRELILGACRDVRKERLLRRLVAMAATLGCAVVGEGVEHAEDLELLRELDVPYAQGFLWAAPQPAGG